MTSSLCRLCIFSYLPNARSATRPCWAGRHKTLQFSNFKVQVEICMSHLHAAEDIVVATVGQNPEAARLALDLRGSSFQSDMFLLFSKPVGRTPLFGEVRCFSDVASNAETQGSGRQRLCERTRAQSLDNNLWLSMSSSGFERKNPCFQSRCRSSRRAARSVHEAPWCMRTAAPASSKQQHGW